jgi:SAM-dependent methyltransferase
MAIDHTLLRAFMRIQDRYKLRGGRMITIGVQDVMFSHESAAEFFRKENYAFKELPESERSFRKSKAQTLYETIFNVKNPMHMHDLFRMLHFDKAESLDAFDADKPTILHDMNKPIEEIHKGQYDLVFDIGSMEHVFDVRMFVQNCIEMVKPGGTLMIYDAMLGWHNECFYNFQTPFFFDVFRANGFEDISVYLNYFPKYHDFGELRTEWRRFEYGDRPKFRKRNHNTHILFIGKRAKVLPEFVIPMQGYYAEYYKDFEAAQAKHGEAPAAELSHYMIENMPRPIQKLFPVLVPIYRAMPTWLRTPIVDSLIAIKNRSKLASREQFRA